MSDDKPEPPKPPEKPSTKTSTVPLKKETVRITLRARPETGAVPPPPSASPPAPKPPAAPPAPPVAAKTQPLKPAPPAAPAPPAGAKTVPLTPAPPTGKMGGAPVAQPTARLTPAPPTAAPAAPGTRPLPKATVKLQPTQPMSGPPTGAVASAPLSTGTMTLEEDSAETGLVPFAVVALVLALAAFTIELVSSQRIIKQDPKTETPGFAVPHPDLARRAGSAGVRVEKPKTGEEFEVDLRYDFAQSMKGAIPIKTYDQFKADQNK